MMLLLNYFQSRLQNLSQLDVLSASSQRMCKTAIYISKFVSKFSAFDIPCVALTVEILIL